MLAASFIRVFDDAAAALEGGERRYNNERFSMALHGQTPGEMLVAKLGRQSIDQLGSTGVRS
jgi:hypothetical protein